MTEELLEWVNAYLEQDDEIVVPIKKMWKEWAATRRGATLEEFIAAVLADGRFEEMPGVDHDEGLEWMTPDELAEHEREMEELGFFSGPRVKLKSREITRDHIAKMIKRHNDRMEWALQQALQSMPEDIEETEEGTLIDIIEKTKELRRYLRELGLDA